MWLKSQEYRGPSEGAQGQISRGGGAFVEL